MTNAGLEILHYFDPHLFSADLRATTKEGVLRELTELVGRSEGLSNASLLFEMLQRREQLGSTGIGKGIAIPHGRSLAMSRLKVAFGRSAEGITYDAIDKKPVHLFFLLVAPPQEERMEYLPLLGRIAELARDRSMRERLKKVESFADLRTILGAEPTNAGSNASADDETDEEPARGRSPRKPAAARPVAARAKTGRGTS
mgnify:CR=1 FL=1